MKIGTRRVSCFGAVCALAVGIPTAGSAQTIAAGPADSQDTLIITGTRETGTKAIQSTAPIEVVGAATLEATGQNNLFDALTETIPSFTYLTTGDYGSFIKAPQLRGLPSGEVLVLVNGKRLHPSAYVVTGGQDEGSNPVDINFLPQGSIDHVEALTDGASAQYGSDAIAGVLNFILKSDDEGLTLSTADGITSMGDGGSADITANGGFKIGNGGFLDLTANYRHQDNIDRTDPYLNSFATSLGNGHNGTTTVLPRGGTISDVGNVSYNVGLPFAGVEVYGFGEGGYLIAQSYEGYRAPGTWPAKYPTGFQPRETLKEWDNSMTEGVRGTFAGWKWDFSNTWGRTSLNQGLIDTINTGYNKLIDAAAGKAVAGQTADQYGNVYVPTASNVTMGGQLSNQVTTNFDITKGFDFGMFAAPLDVAMGLEERYETYSQFAGDPLGYIDGGTQAFSGFPPSLNSNASRQVGAAYVDLATKLTPAWKIDLAGRVEDYSDTGQAETGRFSTRYDFAPWLGIRATVSDGDHAPTLAQDNFGVANVGPAASGLPNAENFTVFMPNSSPGAALLGVPKLAAEKDTDVSAGIVSQITPSMSASVDLYQVYITGRIIGTANLGNNAPTAACNAACQVAANNIAVAAAAANGVSLPGATATNPFAGGSTIAVNFLTNGANTRSRGMDIGFDWRQDLGAYGSIKWSVTANENINQITKEYTPIKALTSAGINSYFNLSTVIADTKDLPISHITLSPTWTFGAFSWEVREARWGHWDTTATYGTPTVIYPLLIHTKYITDTLVGYKVTPNLKMSVGCNNCFDILPAETPYFLRYPPNSSKGGGGYVTPPWSLNGTYVYGRLVYTY